MIQKDYVDQAKSIIDKELYMTIASCTSLTPWITPVYTAFDENYNFYWRSNKEAIHSSNIRKNCNVALTLFNSQAAFGTGKAVYFKAKANECTDIDEISKASFLLADRVNRKAQPVELYQGKNLKRIYKAVIEKAWINAVKIVDNEIYDERIEINIDSLIAL